MRLRTRLRVTVLTVFAPACDPTGPGGEGGQGKTGRSKRRGLCARRHALDFH